MINAGIYPGDELIVDRSLEAQHGRIVVAIINNELTVKRLHKKGGGDVQLLAENPDFPPIIIKAGQELSIWGVVTRCLHKL